MPINMLASKNRFPVCVCRIYRSFLSRSLFSKLLVAVISVLCVDIQQGSLPIGFASTASGAMKFRLLTPLRPRLPEP